MNNTRKGKHTFRFILSIGTIICWLLPIIIISTTASMLMNRTYNRNLRSSTAADVSSALRQVEIRLNYAIEDCKSISYDGVTRQAYRDYQRTPEDSDICRALSDYLSQKFSRNVNYRAVFISFPDPAMTDILPFVSAPGVSNVDLLHQFHTDILPAAQKAASSKDTDIFFMTLGEDLYMMRNLLDSNSQAYALLIFQLEKTELFQSMHGLFQNQTLDLTIDGVPIPLGPKPVIDIPASRIADLTVESNVDGHIIVCNAQVIGLNLWTTIPMLRWIVLFVSALVVPMLSIIIFSFYRNINRPISMLIDANMRVQSGERGFQITKAAPNLEFDLLYRHFNSMSSELESQFTQLYKEQQALQQAKIKALQSQINPHFLNNTLEIINWEARFAGNDQVCSMIEAMSTMLDAAIGRDGRSLVLLSEEIKYADAYLYITKTRLGDRLTITTSLDPDTLNCSVPLLILQPILENAVEYDLSRTGGNLSLKSYLIGRDLHIEIEHDGRPNAAGWAKIQAGLHANGDADGRSVGIRNVVNRLSLIYGEKYFFDIRQSNPGKVLAEAILYDCVPTRDANI